MAKTFENSCPVPAGVLLIIGGAESKGKDRKISVLPEYTIHWTYPKCFTELLRHKDATIEIITSASAQSAESIGCIKGSSKNWVVKTLGISIIKAVKKFLTMTLNASKES